MRVLIDSSVWVDFFNGHPSPEAATLEHLIREDAELVTCGLIASEVLRGLRDSRTILTIEHHFREMEWLTPAEPRTYVEAASLFRRLRGRGVTVRSTIDCIIASLASEARILILAKDRDLALIIDSKILDLRAMPVI